MFLKVEMEIICLSLIAVQYFVCDFLMAPTTVHLLLGACYSINYS